MTKVPDSGATIIPGQPRFGTSCLGCAVLFILPIALGAGIRSYVKHREARIVSARTQRPPHRVPFSHLTRIPDGEPRISGESVIVAAYLWDSGNLAGLPQFFISESRDRRNAMPVEVPECRDGRTTSCFVVHQLGAQYTFGGLFSRSGALIDENFKVDVHGTLSIEKAGRYSGAALERRLAIVEIAEVP